MKVGEYEWFLDVEPLRPPIGALTHVGRVTDALRRLPDGRVQRLAAPVGEHFGHDAREAQERTNTTMRAWVEQQRAATDAPGATEAPTDDRTAR